MQTTLLGLATALIIALVAALVGPFFIDWKQFRPQFEAEAARVIGAPVRVDGALDARLLPTPTLRLRSVVIGGANDAGRARADKLDVLFSLGSLMRGEWRADELTLNGVSLDIGLDAQGRIDWPASAAFSNLGTLAIDRLALTGRIALHDAASRSTIELNDIAFAGDVRALAGSIRGDGNFMLSGTRYPFRFASSRMPDRVATRVHLTVDPGERPLAVDLDGLLSFDARTPRFDGALTLAGPAPPARSSDDDAARAPWRIAAKLKADPSTARLEQLEISYGQEATALKLLGNADLGFGATPLLRTVLSARQLDADRLLARDSAAGPRQWLPTLRNLIAAIPSAPLATQIELGAEQIMIGGRPLQNLAAEIHGDPKSWTIDRLDFRGPGGSRLALSGALAEPGPSGVFKGAVSLDAADPDLFAAWLLGRSETRRGQKPLRARGDIRLASDGIAIDGLRAEFDGSTLQGRIAYTRQAVGSRVDAALTADRLDLDAAAAFARAVAGPQAEWPEQCHLALDVVNAAWVGQSPQPFKARLGYGPDRIALEQLKIGEASGMLIEGNGSFDRGSTTGRLQLSARAASLGQLTAAIAPLAPKVAARLDASGAGAGTARVMLALELGKSPQADRANARAALEFDTSQIKGSAVVTATPPISAIRAADVAALGRDAIGVDAKLSSARGESLLALLGLDRALAAGDGPARFEGKASGIWGGALRLNGKLSGGEIDAELQGSAEPWAAESKAVVDLTVRRANLAPRFDLPESDATASTISLSSRATLAGRKLSFDDIDGSVAGSRLRGRIALTPGDDNAIDGEIGLDTLELGPAFGFAIGAAGRDGNAPLGRGLLKGWRGRLAFQALRGVLPGGSELRPVSGAVVSDGQSLTFEALKGTIGGGEAKADFDAKQSADGTTLNARLQFSGVDGSALRFRGLAMPPSQAAMQMTLSSAGRSASALVGALSGGGVLNLDSARIAGLDPKAFAAAIRGSDAGIATDDLKLRQIVEPVLSAGVLPVATAQLPFSIKDGRISLGTTTLQSAEARATVSGGYDFVADQADLRANLVSTADGAATARPEIQIFAAGPPDRLERSVDVAALSSWLAVRAIDRETRKFEALERDGPSPVSPASVSPMAVDPATAEPPTASTTPGLEANPPASTVPLPGSDPRRTPAKKLTAPRPAALPPAARAPIVSDQVAPLPPPIEIKPAPDPKRQPRLRPPLVLTPSVGNSPRASF